MLPHITTCLNGHVTLGFGTPPLGHQAANFGGFRHCSREDKTFLIVRWSQKTNFIVGIPPSFCRGVVEPLTKFLEGGCWERGGLQFSHKNKLKSEIFNDKKSLSAKIFFSVITNNSNWEILPKNLVNF